MASPFNVGDYVQIVLPDPDGIDAQYDGKTGRITEKHEDGLGDGAGDDRYNHLYTIELEDGDQFQARWTDLTYYPDPDDETPENL